MDAALLRRLEKHIHVGLPNEETRKEILKTYVSKDIQKLGEFSNLINQTEGYSCADIKLLCKEAFMKQLRPIWKYLESNNIIKNKIVCDNFINNINYLKESMRIIKPISIKNEDKYKKWNRRCNHNEETDESDFE